MLDHQLQAIATYRVDLESVPEVIGPVPEGLRVNFLIRGGEVRGAKINAQVRPFGADWMTVRSDGVGQMDVRTTLQTDNGALIDLRYTGVADLGADGYQKFMDNALPARLRLQAALRFSTAHPAYEWLNRLQCIAIGEADMQALVATYEIYAVR